MKSDVLLDGLDEIRRHRRSLDIVLDEISEVLLLGKHLTTSRIVIYSIEQAVAFVFRQCVVKVETDL